MTTITLKVSEADKKFMQAIAKFEGVSLSELIRTKTLEAIEDEYDARVADLALAESRRDLSRKRWGGAKLGSTQQDSTHP